VEEFKCPLKDIKQCPQSTLLHFAANKMMVENGEYVKKIKELKARLKAAHAEIDSIVKEMKKLAREADKDED